MSGWGAIISGAASQSGSIFSSIMSRRNAAEAHDWSKEDASTDRQWQESMANSAHQREVADLKAAGLNPILSGTGGAGAATPGGAMATVDKADTPEMNTQGAVANALEAKMQTAQRDLLKAQEEQASTAAEVNKATKGKLEKETAIMGPQSTIMQKFDEAIKSVPRLWRNHLKEQTSEEAIRLHNSRVKNPQKP